MRIMSAGAALALVLGANTALGEPGRFFKNLFSGDGKTGEGSAYAGPQAYDPSEPYCPPVTVADGGAAIQSYSGGSGDNSRLRHQLTFGRFSRECTLRGDGSIAVKVGVELRALLGPAGAPGRFDTSITFATQYNGTVLSTRSRRVTVNIPNNAASGTMTAIEPDLVVPQNKAIGYAITVSLGAAPAKAGPQVVKRSPKPNAGEPATAQ